MSLRHHAVSTARPAIRPPAPAPPSPVVRAGTQTGGQALDRHTQSRMSARFGHDFSQIRIHTDSRAEDSAQALDANAYAHGTDIVFGEGQYQPGSPQTERLLAHELTHIVQQSRWGAGDSTRMSNRADASEREADALAGDAAAGQTVDVQARPGAAIARDKDEGTWNSCRDNPIYDFITNNALSEVTSVGQQAAETVAGSKLNKSLAGTEDARDAAIRLEEHNYMRNSEGISSSEAPAGPPLKPGTPDIETMIKEELFHPNGQPRILNNGVTPLEEYGSTVGEGAQAVQDGGQVVEEGAQAASRWGTVGTVLRGANHFLNPVGVISNGISLRKDIRDGKYFDAFADAAGLGSAAIGTLGTGGGAATALGAGGLGGGMTAAAAAAAPVAGVLGAFAGGYAGGKLLYDHTEVKEDARDSMDTMNGWLGGDEDHNAIEGFDKYRKAEWNRGGVGGKFHAIGAGIGEGAIATGAAIGGLAKGAYHGAEWAGGKVAGTAGAVWDFATDDSFMKDMDLQRKLQADRDAVDPVEQSKDLAQSRAYLTASPEEKKAMPNAMALEAVTKGLNPFGVPMPGDKDPRH